jgi:tetratricopeptide (TPR) repeat protein
MAETTRKQQRKEIEKAFKRREPALVIVLAETYLKKYPDSGIALFYYGRSLMDFHRYKEAEVTFKKIIEMTDSGFRTLPYKAMGDLCAETGDLRKAAEWYRKAQKLDPNEASHHIFIGVMHFRAGKLAEAEQCFRAALLCKEGCFDEAYFNLGSVLVARGRYEEAVECYQKAIEIDPKYKEAKACLKDVEKAIEAKMPCDAGRGTNIRQNKSISLI